VSHDLRARAAIDGFVLTVLDAAMANWKKPARSWFRSKRLRMQDDQ
jgi:hypothetical protein